MYACTCSLSGDIDSTHTDQSSSICSLWEIPNH